MVLGVGTDILNINRIRTLCDDVSDPFFEKVYTPEERRQAMARPDPAVYFSTRFAGKEAVFKCLGIDNADIRLCEIEIVDSETGQPRVNLLGELKIIAEEKGFRHIDISLSFETEYALAFALGQD